MTENAKLDEYSDLAQGLLDLYSVRNTLFARMDDMYYSRFTMPEGVPEWVLKVVSTDPHDAVLTTARTFATLEPKFKVMPLLPNEANRDRANQIETAIAYNFKQAGRRNDASVVWDVMWSSALYAEVAAQVVYLPYQEKILKTMGKDTKRLKAAQRFGDYAFIIHNPANIYPEWSEYGLEGVLAVRVQTVDEFQDTWGNLAEKVVSEEDYNEGIVSYVTSFDYTNYEKRCVWGVFNDTDAINVKGTGKLILEEENKLGFIPYAIRRWGNSLSTAPEERVMPLLQSVYDSGQWDMLNVFESLDASLSIVRAGQVQYAGEFPAGQEPEIDNTEPAGVLKLPPGTRNFTPLPGQQVDQRIAQQKGEFRSGIWQSSVSKILQSLEFPGGTPSSSVNQLLSQAANSLSPYKLLAQNTLAELAHLMLCWGKYYDKEYGKGSTSLYGQYGDKSRMGKEIRIPFDTIDPDALVIDVTLTADKPVDKLQQVNAAVLLKQNFKIPEAELIEELVGGDPSEMAKRRHLEDYQDAYIQNDLQRMQMQVQLEMQQQMAQQQEAQSQQMQQEQAARQQEQAAAGARQGAAPAQEQAAGIGANPAAGGMPPTMLGAQ